MQITLSKKDLRTVSMIVAQFAVQMNKKGSFWQRGNERLTCVDMGRLSNRIGKKAGVEWDFDKAFKIKSNRRSHGKGLQNK